MRRSIPHFVLALLLLALASGCGASRHTTSPLAVDAPEGANAPAAADWTGLLAGRDASGYVPLDLGDRWRYRYDFSASILNPDGTTEPGTQYSSAFEDRLEGFETFDGMAYVIDHRVWDDPGVSDGFIYFRQDASGLFERDVPVRMVAGTSPARAAAAGARSPALPAWDAVAARLGATGAHAAAYRAAWEHLAARLALLDRIGAGPAGASAGPLQGEIQRLAYPLHVGERWVIRADPLFESWVESPIRVSTDGGVYVGWNIRIRTLNELWGARDRVRTFWGRDGYLGLRATLVADATDQDGNVIGSIVAHQSETLLGFWRAHR